MPEMDGFSLVEWMQQNGITASTPVIMLTSSGQRGESTHCRELGVAAYLTKPILQTELREAILSVIAAHSLQEGEDSEKAPVAIHSAREIPSQRKFAKPADPHLHVLLAEDNVVNQKRSEERRVGKECRL